MYAVPFSAFPRNGRKFALKYFIEEPLMPFTRDDFFRIINLYNLDVGRVVWLFYAVAIIILFQLYRRRTGSNQLALGFLAFLWGWMGIVYHWIYFSQINPAARIFGAFFVLQALFFAYITWKNWKLEISSLQSLRGIFQLILFSYSLLIYPLLGIVFGRGYPNGPIFGLPCPTTIFTLALLSGLEHKPNKVVLIALIPLLWAMIGTTAAKLFGVTEDYMLGVSAAAFVIVHFLSLVRPSFRSKHA
jgi:hypothetical protein